MLSLVYEKKLARQGFQFIAGVDEVGRGPLAGPIVAAAVILPSRIQLPGLNDSKKLTARQREELFRQINQQALQIGVGLVDHATIDRINVGKANQLVIKLAVENLAVQPDCLLIDGPKKIKGLPLYQRALIGGDGRCASIAAASIIAKVTRDHLMIEYHRDFPAYGFDRHKGYGTKEHFRLIARHGLSPIHRRTFC